MYNIVYDYNKSKEHWKLLGQQRNVDMLMTCITCMYCMTEVDFVPQVLEIQKLLIIVLKIV